MKNTSIPHDFVSFKQMSHTAILTENIAPSELTDLFCKNQQEFYNYIAHYTATNNNIEDDTRPLRFHRIENMIDCIFSPNKQWSFYNAAMDTDFYHTLKESRREVDADRIMKKMLSLASNYRCPIRILVKPTATDTLKLLKQHGFFELPIQNDSFQYVDFYHTEQKLKQINLSSDIIITELDDTTQDDCSKKKSEWGYVLCQSFGLHNPEIYGPFYSNIWSKVNVGPTKQIRMFIATINDRIVGGCHVNFACGIASLFNVTTLKTERGKGIGKALSLAAMICAKEAGYRYIVLQGSEMGLQIYKKLGFQPIPSNKLLLKLTTIAWYYKIVEIVLSIVSIQSLQNITRRIQKPSITLLLIMTIISTIIISLLIVKIIM